MRVSGGDESQRLHGGAPHRRWQLHSGGGDTGKEAYDGFDATWVTCVAQSFQDGDHLALVTISQALIGYVDQRLV